MKLFGGFDRYLGSLQNLRLPAAHTGFRAVSSAHLCPLRDQSAEELVSCEAPFRFRVLQPNRFRR